MNAVFSRWCRVLAVGLCGLLRLARRSRAMRTLTGTVLDVVGKGISARRRVGEKRSDRRHPPVAERAAMASSRSTGLPAGTYSIEASAPSFASSRRTGVKLAAGATENVSIALNVGELSQTVTVEGTVSVAAEMAPSQSTLEARSAKSEISPEYHPELRVAGGGLHRVAQ